VYSLRLPGSVGRLAYSSIDQVRNTEDEPCLPAVVCMTQAIDVKKKNTDLQVERSTSSSWWTVAKQPPTTTIRQMVLQRGHDEYRDYVTFMLGDSNPSPMIHRVYHRKLADPSLD